MFIFGFRDVNDLKLFICLTYMAEERLAVISSRMNLKVHEQKLKSVQKGFSLLKCKSDALQIKCKELEEKVKEKECNVNGMFRTAFTLLAEADKIGCDWNIFEKICLESESKLICTLDNACGVPLASFRVEQNEFNREILWKGGHKLREAKKLFDQMISMLIELGSERNGLKAIKTAFEITNKRKNSLEHKMIPKLETTVLYIESELDEAEREEFYRLKKIQTSKANK